VEGQSGRAVTNQERWQGLGKGGMQGARRHTLGIVRGMVDAVFEGQGIKRGWRRLLDAPSEPR
jgi:hypothetical protein